jgi:hypothetical protein
MADSGEAPAKRAEMDVDTVNKEFLAIEFKRTQDKRSNYAEEAQK